MKLKIIVMLLIVVFGTLLISDISVLAYGLEFEDIIVYRVYDEEFNYLFEKDNVAVGDSYLSKDFKFYEVTYVDKDNRTGIAKFIKNVKKPNIEKSFSIKPVSDRERKIAMYMTHNDESYVPTDGVDSVYGNGGIRDVALKFKNELEKNMVNVYFDDTLHIPHDTLAYSRSEKTARKLQNAHSPDAIFDIHRDGTSRRFYVTEVDGVERGRVRMVIGKANSSMALNEEFALYLMAVGNELYPWLFTDIYYATGHYNQSIDSKAILFEMGSHLCEKELILDSMTELAEVVTTALYQTTVDENNGDLTINGDETSTNIIVTDILDKKEEKNPSVLALVIIVILLASVFIYALVMLFYNYNKNKKLDKR